jgi:hypothetical protein
MASIGKVRIFIIVIGALIAISSLTPAHANPVQERAASSKAMVCGCIPGEVLWTYYDTTQSLTTCTSTTTTPCDVGGNGDNILRLINPAGNANPVFGEVTDTCAMIYVFDDEQEMGECCGCPLSPADLATFSVRHNLTGNWIFGGGPDGNGVGAIAVVAVAPNVDVVLNGSAPTNGHNCALSQSAACNAGCDPTSQPGYVVTTSNNLLGGIVHNQFVGRDGPVPSGLTEIPLSDDASGDPNNLVYLQNQCAFLVGGGSGAGVCSCPNL